MQITLKEKKKKPFEFKPLPERINIRRAAKYKTYDLLNGNTVKLPKGKECIEISWSGMFINFEGRGEDFRKNTPTLAQPDKNSNNRKQTPKECVKKLKNWMYTGKVLELYITKPRFRANVTISRLSTNAEGPYGDISYSIEFIRYRSLTIKELKKKPRLLPREAISIDGGTYTVKSGDTLWRIATDKLGSGTQWPVIYDRNKKIIEDTAKKYGRKSSDNGHWIYPGTNLVIPLLAASTEEVEYD